MLSYTKDNRSQEERFRYIEKEEKAVKDFIVVIAFIILGVFLALIILNLKSKGTAMGDKATGAIDSLTNQLTTS